MNNKFNNTQELADWLDASGLMTPIGFRKLLNGDEVAINLGFLLNFTNALADRATEAGTPAKATIDTPEFGRLLEQVGKVCSWSEALAAKADLVEHIDQHASALAEEARREAERLNGYWRAGFTGAEICPTTRGGALAAYADGQKAAAQRTAGGDAVAYRWRAPEPGAAWEYTEQAALYSARSGYIREALGVIGSQPVAEAAAQADDVPMLYARQADLDTQGADKAVLTYALPDDKWNVPLYAAPTAQPTPAKTPEIEGIAAQPTLPDDELSKSVLHAIYRACQRGGSPEQLHAAIMPDVRTALRQPGALPDEAEDAARIDWLEQNNQTFCGNYGGTDFRAIGSSLWHGTLREAIDGARIEAAARAAAAKGDA